MPAHDWTRVEAGIFHDFHHAWIEELKRTLNRGILPPDYYALAEQRAAGLAPDVITLQELGNGQADDPAPGAKGGTLVAASPVPRTAQADMAHYRRKQSTVTVRHSSEDRVVAMVEVVSPGNKASRRAFQTFLGKVGELLDKGIHLLILDVHPPGKRDPHGLHAAIWEEITDEESAAAPAKPLTLAAYESDDGAVNAYVLHAAVGEPLPEMPLYLEPGACVVVPVEATYQAAFGAVPRRWQRVLEGGAV